MSLWPFRRKSRRRRARTTPLTDVDDGRGRRLQQDRPQNFVGSDTVDDSSASIVRQPLKNVVTDASGRQRLARNYSFSPGRHDTIAVGRGRGAWGRQGSIPPVPPLPSARAIQSLTHKARASTGPNEHPLRSLGEYVLARVPTLHYKRGGEHLMPRKVSSQKRRRDDAGREAEIKAMSSLAPVRPAAQDWTAGRPMKKDSKRVKTGLGFGLGGAARHEWRKTHQSSEVSLPVPESIRSSLSADSEHMAYRVSALESLAPRPTLRCAVNPRLVPVVDESAVLPTRTPSQRNRALERPPIPEATLRAHKRVDDLADVLSAGDLREVLERDQRRRQRKRQREQDRAERHLARQAERQKADDAAAVQGGQPRPNLERGVVGREGVGLGIDPASAVVTSSRRRELYAQPLQTGSQPDRMEAEHMDQRSGHEPLRVFHRTDSIPLETPVSPPEPEEARPPANHSPGRRAPPHKGPRSKSPLSLEERSKPPLSLDERAEEAPKGEESSSFRGPLSWTSLFRWPTRSRRRSGGTPSFSNTSRDSMQQNQPPASGTAITAHGANAAQLRSLSKGVPKRTMSRFREDLPELPTSPTQSRTQSPEADPFPETIAEASLDVGSGHPDGDTTAFFPASESLKRSNTKSSGYRSVDEMRMTPSDEVQPSPEPHAMSLASIDSEGTWLSGRLERPWHSSGAPPYANRSRGQLSEQERGSENLPGGKDDSEPDDGSPTGDGPAGDSPTVDDVHVPASSGASGERHQSNLEPTDECPSPEGSNEKARWGLVNERLPTVIHSANRVRSREGLLKSFEEGESDVDETTDDYEDAREQQTVQSSPSEHRAQQGPEL